MVRCTEWSMSGVKEELKLRLIADFPAIRIPYAAIYGGSPERAQVDDEVQELCSFLADRTWQEIDAKVVGKVVEYLPLMSDEAFVAYLPTFLLRGIETLEEGEWIAKTTAFNLNPSADGKMIPYMLARLKRFNANQSRLVAEWLNMIAQRPVSKLLANYVERALGAYWADWLTPKDGAIVLRKSDGPVITDQSAIP